ncbi:response regulator transcription factor [Roseivirga sp.]|uniref:response regulator transcription factor n=1 Tax=Roseivirga sp. TaxID=1964215 RepID=UPI003B51DD1A
MRILLVEDEQKLASFIVKGLEDVGYTIDLERDGSKAIELAATENYDLILLDIMLPGQNGFDVLRNIREFSINSPVIFISALSDSEHIIKGLDMGAVDYIKKPFDFEELKARVRNVQRKFGGQRTSVFQVNGLSLDLLKREVVLRNEVIELSKREFSILELLVRNTNRVVSKSEITEKVWNVNFDMSSNVVEVHMHQLRKKLEKNDSDKLIQTMVGYGYKIEGELIKK